MLYVTYYKKINPNTNTTNQITFDQLFDAEGVLNTNPDPSEYLTPEVNGTFKTFQVAKLNDNFKAQLNNNYTRFIEKFQSVMDSYFTENDMHKHYTTFEIPKHSGGTRTINAPDPILKNTLKDMKIFFEYTGILPNTAAYAYTKNRTAKDAIIRHQKTGHTWFLKLDLHDFFGSCSKQVIMSSLCQIPFFAQLTSTDWDKFLHVAMLDGGLPQGTPLSPWLTNQIMLPYDFQISKACHEHNLTYTRYADDMLISGNSKEAIYHGKEIIETALKNTGFTINEEKTKISSIYGKNWNLGLMLNKDKEITVGWKKKEEFRATLFNFLYNPNNFAADWCSQFLGITNYYTQIEPKYFTKVIDKYNKKFNIDTKEVLISRIKGATIEE